MDKTKGKVKPVKATKAKPLRLKVGKTYETRDERYRVKIVDINLEVTTDGWPMKGEFQNRFLKGKLNSWTPIGGFGFTDQPDKWDLIREVKPKPPTRR